MEWSHLHRVESTHAGERWRLERAQSVALPFPEAVPASIETGIQSLIQANRMRLLENHPVLTQFLFKDTPSFANMDGSMDALCEYAHRQRPIRLGDWVDDYITSICALHVYSVTFCFPHFARAVVMPSSTSRMGAAITFWITSAQNEEDECHGALHSRSATALQHYTREDWTAPSVPPTITRPGESISLRNVLSIPLDICYMDARWDVSSVQKIK